MKLPLSLDNRCPIDLFRHDVKREKPDVTTHFTAKCTPYLFNDVRRRPGYQFGAFSAQYLFNMINYPLAKIIVTCFHLSQLSSN